MNARRIFTLAIVVSMAASSNAALFLINSPQSFYRANGEAPFFTPAIDLNANGFFAGQTVVMSRLGQWQKNPGSGLYYGLSVVFSSSNVLLGPTNLNRVVGAIDAGTDWTSPNTAVGGLSTDIAEDFLIDNMAGTASPVTVVIPAGALYVIGAATDDFYTDNNNAPEFYLRISRPVPEPASMATLGIGAMALLRRRRNRKG